MEGVKSTMESHYTKIAGDVETEYCSTQSMDSNVTEPKSFSLLAASDLMLASLQATLQQHKLIIGHHKTLVKKRKTYWSPF